MAREMYELKAQMSLVEAENMLLKKWLQAIWDMEGSLDYVDVQDKSFSEAERGQIALWIETLRAGEPI